MREALGACVRIASSRAEKFRASRGASSAALRGYEGEGPRWAGKAFLVKEAVVRVGGKGAAPAWRRC